MFFNVVFLSSSSYKTVFFTKSIEVQKGILFVQFTLTSLSSFSNEMLPSDGDGKRLGGKLRLPILQGDNSEFTAKGNRRLSEMLRGQVNCLREAEECFVSYRSSARLPKVRVPEQEGSRSIISMPQQNTKTLPQQKNKTDYSSLLVEQAKDLKVREAESEFVLAQPSPSNQMRKSDGKRISLKKIKPPTEPVKDQTKWEWEDSYGVWHLFDLSDAGILEEAFRSGNDLLERSDLSFNGGGSRFKFDFKKMIQINFESNTRRRIRRGVGRQWFEDVFKFKEQTYIQTQRRLLVMQTGTGSALRLGRWRVGKWSCPTLGELRAAGKSVLQESGLMGKSFKISNITTHWHELHRQPENNGAVFQIATNFNGLSSVSSNETPEDGIEGYRASVCEGAVAASSCGAAVAFRNYLLPLGDGKVGQTSSDQLNLLSSLSSVVGDVRWDIANGIIDADLSSLAKINRKISSFSPSQLDSIRESIRIGLHLDTEVTLSNAPHEQFVGHACCGVVDSGHSELQANLWEPLSTLILEATFEATLWASVIYNFQRKDKNNGRRQPVFLSGPETAKTTNRMFYANSIFAACSRLRTAGVGLDVRIVHNDALVPQQFEILAKGLDYTSVTTNTMGAYFVGNNVEVRDSESNSWLPATVTAVIGPSILVKPKDWKESYRWEHIRHVNQKSFRKEGTASETNNNLTRRTTLTRKNIKDVPQKTIKEVSYSLGEHVLVRDDVDKKWKPGVVTKVEENNERTLIYVLPDDWESAFSFCWNYIKKPIIHRKQSARSRTMSSTGLPNESVSQPIISSMIKRTSTLRMNRKSSVRRKLYTCYKGHILEEMKAREAWSAKCHCCSGLGKRGGGGKIVLYNCSKCRVILCKRCCDLRLVEYEQPLAREDIETDELRMRDVLFQQYAAGGGEFLNHKVQLTTESAVHEAMRVMYIDIERVARNALKSSFKREIRLIHKTHQSSAMSSPNTVVMLLETSVDDFDRSQFIESVATQLDIPSNSIWIQGVMTSSSIDPQTVLSPDIDTTRGISSKWTRQLQVEILNKTATPSEQQPPSLSDGDIVDELIENLVSPPQFVPPFKVDSNSSLKRSLRVGSPLDRIQIINNLVSKLSAISETCESGLKLLLLRLYSSEGADIDRLLGWNAPAWSDDRESRKRWADYIAAVKATRNTEIYSEVNNGGGWNRFSEMLRIFCMDEIGRISRPNHPVNNILYRGLYNLNSSDLERYAALKEGDRLCVPTLQSFTLSENITNKFIKSGWFLTASRNNVCLQVKEFPCALTTSEVSCYGLEQEVLVPPAVFEVESVSQMKLGYQILLRPHQKSAFTLQVSSAIDLILKHEKRLQELARVAKTTSTIDVVMTFVGHSDDVMRRWISIYRRKGSDRIEPNILAAYPCKIIISDYESDDDSPIGTKHQKGQLLSPRTPYFDTTFISTIVIVFVGTTVAAAIPSPPPGQLFNAASLGLISDCAKLFSRGTTNIIDPTERRKYKGKSVLHLAAQHKNFNEPSGIKVLQQLIDICSTAARFRGGDPTQANALLATAILESPPPMLLSIKRLPPSEVSYIVKWLSCVKRNAKDRKKLIKKNGKERCSGCVRCCGCARCVVGSHWCQRACDVCGKELQKVERAPWEAWQCALCMQTTPPGARTWNPKRVVVLGNGIPSEEQNQMVSVGSFSRCRHPQPTISQLEANTDLDQCDTSFYCCPTPTTCLWGCCSDCFKRITGAIPAWQHSHLGDLAISSTGLRTTLRESTKHLNGISMAIHSGGCDVKDILRHISLTMLDLQEGVENATALHLACYNGRVEVARLLLAAGSNPDLETNKGHRPLYLAVTRRVCIIIYFLFMVSTYLPEIKHKIKTGIRRGG